MSNSKEAHEGPEQPIETTPERAAVPVMETEVIPETESAEPSERGDKAEMKPEPTPATVQMTAAPAVPAKEVARDPVLIEVENKLSEGLWDAYKSMDPGLRAKFKAEGERIAGVARDGIASGRLAAERLLQMIVDWLRMIPRVDRWFLVQDAKLKTDALIRMSKGRDGER